ncbi:MAG: hypothetical protein A3K19_11740 [Lentisphaerae bacterium RIFOXYB12_FULL_65_16]|nr:MAG: hypothetical protein A3K18_23210 [Lentisphaerae bacterium RIFOXYA12_64_32]OGV87985.1 MAG: hypothetical protein A3K19_11740 [Lentisphaerae bacterium RIFOXYB12_FULL_65_16]
MAQDRQQHTSPSDATLPCLLAVDVGMRCGLAWFRGDGVLLDYLSRSFPSRAGLKTAVRQLCRRQPLTHLVLEGGGDTAEPWLREATRLGLDVESVSAETWREDLLYLRQRRTGQQAKRTADTLARDVIARCGGKKPTSLRTDAAEAILCGYWAARRLFPAHARGVVPVRFRNTVEK